MAAPKWFETTTYFNNKLAQMQRDEPEGNWTADSLTAAFEEGSYNVNSADSMYTHFEQYGNTATERVSPNQYFDNDYYMNSKLAQMQATNPGYTMAQLETAMFAEGNMSPWTHYTLYGITEGIDPSAGFNTKEYMAAKLAQMQAEYPDENWTMDSLFEAFRAGNLNPIEHYFEYGVTENLDFTPGGGVTPPAEYNEIPLVAGEHEFTGTAGNDNFVGDVASSASKSTLQRDDVIDGGEGQDMLSVSLATTWGGFSSKGGMSNVETVSLDNTTSRDLSFNAGGIKGAEIYNLEGAINLSNIETTGIAVNYSDVHTSQPLSIAFASGATAGTDDSLAIGVENVYIPGRSSDQPNTAVKINARGIEDVAVTSTGSNENIIDLSGVDFMRSLAVDGEAKIKVLANGTALTSIDASEATAAVNVSVNQGSFSGPQIRSAKFGSGDDTLNANVAPEASIDGGEGWDAVNITGATGSYALTTAGVENIGVIGNNGNVTLIGTNVDGLERLTLNGTRNQVTLGQFVDSQLEVQAEGTNTAKVVIADISDVTVNVGDGYRGDRDTFTGKLELDATRLTINADDGSWGGAEFNAEIDADQVADLALAAGKGAKVNVKSGSDLSGVSNIQASGYGIIDLADGTLLARDAQSVYVDAQRLVTGTLNAVFKGNLNDASLNISGSNMASNNITVDSSYASVQMAGGMNADTLRIISDGTRVYTPTNLSVDLGGGNDGVIVEGRVAAGYDFSGLAGVEEISFVNTNLTASDQGRIAAQLGIDAGNVHVNSSGVGTAVAPIILPASVLAGDTAVNVAPDGFTQTSAAGLTEADMSNVTIQSGGTFTITEVGENFSGTLPPSGGNVVLNAADGGGENWRLIADSSQTTTVTVNQGEAGQTGQTLTLINNGTGALNLETDLTVNTQYVTGAEIYHQTSLTIASASEAGTSTVVGGTHVLPSGSQLAKTLMPEMSNVVITGGADTELNAQMGNADVENLTFDASGSTGDVSVSMLAAQVIKYTGSTGDDWIAVAPYESGSSINLGSGSDGVQLNLTRMEGESGKNFGTVNVDLGAGDNMQDKILIYLDGSKGADASDTGAKIIVSGFEVGNDIITQGRVAKGVVFTDDVKFTQALANFGVTDATTADNSSVAYSGTAGNYTAWFFLKGDYANVSNKFADTTGIDTSHVALVGVTGLATNTGTLGNFTDWDTVSVS